MTASRHRVLIVEDDRPTAEDLADIVKALDCESVVVDNKSDALAALERETFCLALLDLQIRIDKNSIRGHVEAGHSLVRDVRKRYPDHAGIRYRLPILVVSGHAREADSAVAVMKDGADDLVQKPLDSRRVSECIRQALQLSGRSSHEACTQMTTSRAGGTEGLAISFPGDRERRRTHVRVGSKSLKLTDTMLAILLRLVVGKLAGKPVHKVDLGATGDYGFKRISELRKALEPALGDGIKFIENDHQGSYWIAVPISVVDSNVEALIAIGVKSISDLAEQLRPHCEPKT